MLKTPIRILRLLALLQGRGEWTGQELAARLRVTPRTVRRDMDRLRRLGYGIDASVGPGGGYRLRAGSTVPPLLLDDEEAVAVAAALATAAANVTTVRETALGILAKLDRLLPPRLKGRLGALDAVTLNLGKSAPHTNPALLLTLAAACRDSLLLRFRYRSKDGNVSIRDVEPARLAHTGRIWYLAAWDRDRGDWRTFRVDRIDPSGLETGSAFVPRVPPEDFSALVSRSLATSPYPSVARFRLPGTREELVRRVPSWVGTLEAEDAGHCILTIRADSPTSIAASILLAAPEFTLLEPESMAKPLREAGRRLLRGTRLSLKWK